MGRRLKSGCIYQSTLPDKMGNSGEKVCCDDEDCPNFCKVFLNAIDRFKLDRSESRLTFMDTTTIGYDYWASSLDISSAAKEES